jgi:hypothetical protein
MQSTPVEATSRGKNWQQSLEKSYAGSADEAVPLAAYGALVAVFLGAVAVALRVGKKRGALPIRIATSDILLLGVAVHRLTRALTRDKVASPLRAPFTRYEGSSGEGEVHERPRGGGLRRALGTLLTCQFCAGPWAALGLTVAFVARPRATRLVASGLAMVTMSDFLHQLYAFARRASSAREARATSSPPTSARTRFMPVW